MSELSDRAATELRAIVQAYAAGEAEVVQAYFAQPHTMDEHVEVLLRQMGREVHTADWLRRAVRMLDDLDVTVDRHGFAEFLEQIAEETAHYVILADLADWAARRTLSAAELHRYEVYARWNPDVPTNKLYNALLPEANRMIDVSRALVEDLGFERGMQVARLSEGGGGGAFAACAELTGDTFRERLADAMRRILRDEVDHGPGRIDNFACTWVQSAADLAVATRWLRTFMAQHLRVRNEIWLHPLTPARLEAIDQGDVTPVDARLALR